MPIPPGGRSSDPAIPSKPPQQSPAAQPPALKPTETGATTRTLARRPTMSNPLRDQQAPAAPQAIKDRKARPLESPATGSGLPGRDQLIAKAGAPREDIVVAGHLIRRASTRYKAVLEQLHLYHAAMATLAAGSPRALDRAQAAAAALRDELAAYLADARHKRSEELEPLKELAAREVEVLGKLSGLDRLASTSQLPGYPLAVLLPLLREGVDARTIGRGMLKGLDVECIASFGRAGLPICAASIAAAPAALSGTYGEPRFLGRGEVATVMRVEATRSDGSTTPLVFKPERIECDPGSAAAGAGIPSRRPNLAGRATATFLVAQRLGLPQVPPTAIARIGGMIGSLMAFAPGRAPLSDDPVRCPPPPSIASEVLAARAIAMGFGEPTRMGGDLVLHPRCYLVATGDIDEHDEPVRVERPVSVMRALDPADPQLRMKLTQLQWLDALCGQVDRSPRNYFIERRADGQCQVTAIDNDASFGSGLKDFVIAPQHAKSRLLPALPRVIDAQLRNALLALGESDLRGLLRGLLSETEVASAARRLRVIQAALRSTDTMVVQHPDDWSGKEVGAALGLSDALDERLDEIGRIHGDDPDGCQGAVENLRDASTARRISYLAREMLEQTCVRWLRRRFGHSEQLSARLEAIFDPQWLSEPLGPRASDDGKSAGSERR